MKLFELDKLGDFLITVLKTDIEARPFSIHLSKNEKEDVVFVLQDKFGEELTKGSPQSVINLLRGQDVTILQKYDKSEIAEFFDWWWKSEDSELTMGGADNFLKAFNYWEQNVKVDEELLEEIKDGN